MTTRSIEHQTKVPEIRKGDTVVVLSGKDAGKRGKVEHVIRRDPSPSPGALRLPPRVAQGRRVRGRRRVSTSLASTPSRASARRAARARMPTVDPGGVLDHAMPLPVARVMVVCSHCDRPTRVGHRTLDNGTRVRVCLHCGEPLEVKA